MKNKLHFAIYLIIVVSLLVRIVNIVWGLSLFDKYVNDRYHPDEFKIVMGAKNFPKDIFSRTDLRYPTALHYMVGIFNLPVKKANLPVDDIQMVYVIGRIISVLFGVASVYCTYLLGKRLSNEYGGLVAASLLAVSLYHVRESSVITTDVATSFWAVYVLLQTQKLDATSRIGRYILLGASFGLLVGTKYTGAFLALPVLLLFLCFYLNSPQHRKRILLMFALFFATSLAMFFISTPGILLKPTAFLTSLQFESNRLSASQSSFWDVEFYSHFFSSLSQSSNLFICFAIAWALFLVVVRRPGFHLNLYALVTVIYYLYFNTALLPRYWVMLLPILCVLAGWGIVTIYDDQKFRSFSLGLFIVAFGLGVYQNVLLVGLAYNDTRSAAAQFLAQQVPDAKILLGFGSQENDGWQYPYVKQQLVRNSSDSPDYIVLSSFVDDLPAQGDLMIKTNSQEARYIYIKTFTPINNLQVEFMSPTIEVFAFDR